MPQSCWKYISFSIFLLFSIVACQPVGSTRQALDEMVPVPAGRFPMGANLPQPGDESPQHLVTLPAFWIDRYEVSNAHYRKCVEAGACNEPQDLRFYQDVRYANHPVAFVTWYQADTYCRWLDERLPAESEWEKAARGTQGWDYPWGNGLLPEKLNAGLRFTGMLPVGSFPEGASPYGALDMAGNVWEWTADWYMPYPGSHYRSDLFGEKYKVVRGGSWNHPIDDARSYHRDIASPTRALAVVGFRCVAALRQNYLVQPGGWLQSRNR